MDTSKWYSTHTVITIRSATQTLVITIHAHDCARGNVIGLICMSVVDVVTLITKHEELENRDDT